MASVENGMCAGARACWVTLVSVSHPGRRYSANPDAPQVGQVDWQPSIVVPQWRHSTMTSVPRWRVSRERSATTTLTPG